MERQVDKMNRTVAYVFAPAVDYEDISGKNNSWFYDRAPAGYKFLLDSIDISNAHVPDTSTGIVAIFDGHEYTHWNIFPGVVSQELLGRFETSSGETQGTINLHGWECKEFSIAVRSLSESLGYKVSCIIWYYLRKMSWLEKLQYAVMQPKGDRYKKAFRKTVDTIGHSKTGGI